MNTFTYIYLPLHGLFISNLQNFTMRCDLHIHTRASGKCTTPGLDKVSLESYNRPLAVYDRCKQLGMSLVTLTDHDSIEGCESLRRNRDFFVSEEITCRMPSGSEMHLGVYDITDRDHVEIQRRRTDFVSLVMYLSERKLFYSVNHVFSGLTGHRDPDDFAWFISYAPAFETRNGQMWSRANRSAEKFARRNGKIPIAGSDSHTMSGVGLTYTEVRGAKTIAEFFAGLRARQGRVRGLHGSYAKITRDVFHIAGQVFREKPYTLAALPLTVLIPAITAAHWFNEIRFCNKWSELLQTSERAPRMLWELESGLGNI